MAGQILWWNVVPYDDMWGCRVNLLSKLFTILFNHVQIVPCGKFHRIGSAPPETFRNVKYDAPEEVGVDRKCFDSPIRK